jgi:DNA topoisomerase VI subunit B
VLIIINWTGHPIEITTTTSHGHICLSKPILINNNRREADVAEHRRLCENYDQGMFGTDISVLVRHVCTAEINRVNVYLRDK